jgi:hypothetical protein
MVLTLLLLFRGRKTSGEPDEVFTFLEYTPPRRVFDYAPPKRQVDYKPEERKLDYTPPRPR